MKNILITLLAALACTELDAQGLEIRDVRVTVYYCVLNSETVGQDITARISDANYTLKAAFLYGGGGASMQGTGSTELGGIYIKYMGGGVGWVHINNPGEFTEEVRNRYARLGITDFTGFGNMALSKPDEAKFEVVKSVIGASGSELKPMRSIAVDKSIIPLGKEVELTFKNGKKFKCVAHDTGGDIRGKYRLDIYVGEGKAALDSWLVKNGGSQLVTVRF